MPVEFIIGRDAAAGSAPPRVSFRPALRWFLGACLCGALLSQTMMAATAVTPASSRRSLLLSETELADKIQGGLLGQMLGDLNGLPHEMRYIQTPGNVTNYTPALPKGAWTDDDTDIEWVYLIAMEKSGRVLLAPGDITRLWKDHINRSIWCANHYTRQLMDLGIDPPLTGRLAVNPWAGFNLSGQFLCESFALIAPGMPRTAARIALHYTHVAIDGEPAQMTQLFAAIIAGAFGETNVVRLVEDGLRAVDPRSETRRIAQDVFRWWRENPADWRAARQKLRDQYTRFNGEMPDKNGCLLNGASALAALLYGNGDFAATLRTAFNFGWDADNNAATSGTVVGVIKGRRWLLSQGWDILDVYRNTTRDRLPAEETITAFGNRMVGLAQRVIAEQGGEAVMRGDQKYFRIRAQSLANVEPLPRPLDRLMQLRRQLRPEIQRGLRQSGLPQARAAYLALCLGEAEDFRRKQPEQWQDAVNELRRYANVVRNIFAAPLPMASRLQVEAARAGLRQP